MADLLAERLLLAVPEKLPEELIERLLLAVTEELQVLMALGDLETVEMRDTLEEALWLEEAEPLT